METREHRVAQGGLFHSHKLKYSKETQDLLHRLIEESKLSILQRQTLRESVKRGEPLPGPTSQSARSRSESTHKSREVLVPPALPRRRSYQAIVKSGAYQREAFDPPFNVNMKNRDVEKQKLQSLMTYGKELPPDHIEVQQQLKIRRNRKEGEEPDSGAIFDHLVEEVRERLEFLHEMEGLGQAKAYQAVIEQEVAAKMRQMAKLDQEKFLRMSESFQGVKPSGKVVKGNSVCKTNNIFPREGDGDSGKTGR